MLLPKNRAFLPTCLMLGALLCSLPAFAQSPAVTAADPVQTQTLLLQHVVPSEILNALHWDQAANLPAGVTQIIAQPDTNSLSVIATPAGFEKVREIIKPLDIALRPVQIKAALANATTADLKASGINFDLVPMPPLFLPGSEMGYAAGPVVTPLLEKLRKQGAVLQSSTIFTANNVNAALDVSAGGRIFASSNVESFTFAVTPRINSDGSVTLALHPQATWRVLGKTNPDGTPATVTDSIETTRTVRDGDTLVFTNLFPGASGAHDNQLLLFVTPTVLPDENHATPKK